MARIAGVDLPRNKRIEVALQYIYGIGRTTALRVLAQTNVNPATKARDLTDDEVARLRAACGTSLLANDAAMLGEIAMMSPQRVFASRLGRIEVFQPIPAPDGVSPEGPHTHVLPRLLKAGRTHAATLPIPDGLVPCLELHLPAGLDHIFDRYPEFADVTRDARLDGVYLPMGYTQTSDWRNIDQVKIYVDNYLVDDQIANLAATATFPPAPLGGTLAGPAQGGAGTLKIGRAHV